jgi:hypothetical protein
MHFIAAETKDPAKKMPVTAISGNGKRIGEARLHGQHVPSPLSRVFVDVERISTAYWCVFGSVGGAFPSTHVMWLPGPVSDEPNKEGTVTIIREHQCLAYLRSN